MSFLSPVKIGDVSLKSNLFLAPMAGYTDKIYRSICIDHGAALAYTEMVSCEGIARNSAKTIMLMDRGESEKHLAVQLFTPDENTARRSAEGVLKAKPDIIDVNMGCPVPKVTKTGCGSALLKNPAEIGRIVKALKEETGLPVTVKIRTGWDNDSINYLETAQQAFSAGADALCMHARTKTKLYMPYADWSTLKDLKQHFPDKFIIGSGDLFTASDAKRMFEETGVDALAFARGAIGNPFIFEQTVSLLETGEIPQISTSMKVAEIKRHLAGLSDYIGENQACREMRKHVCAYLKGISNSAKVRNLVSRAEKIDDYKRALTLLDN